MRLDVARLLIVLNLDEPLLNTIALTGESTPVTITYPWLPHKCLTCHQWGHKTVDCRKQPITNAGLGEKVPIPRDELNTNAETLPSPSIDLIQPAKSPLSSPTRGVNNQKTTDTIPSNDIDITIALPVNASHDALITNGSNAIPFSGPGSTPPAPQDAEASQLRADSLSRMQDVPIVPLMDPYIELVDRSLPEDTQHESNPATQDDTLDWSVVPRRASQSPSKATSTKSDQLKFPPSRFFVLGSEADDDKEEGQLSESESAPVKATQHGSRYSTRAKLSQDQRPHVTSRKGSKQVVPQ